MGESGWGDRVRVPLPKAKAIAMELVSLLGPVCHQIEVAGSIRRRKLFPGDIELLVIPKYSGPADLLDQKLQELIARGVLRYRLNKTGSKMYGLKNKLLMHDRSGMGVDIFSTTEECWPVALAIRTGPKESNIAIAMAARRKGWRLLPYGSGFDTINGLIVCQSEREVFELVGLPYRPPEERDG